MQFDARSAAHRPWPLPSSPWIMTMRWEDLLFAHWPVSADQLRTLVPGGLELDLFENQAWLGVVPFRMSVTRLRGLPPVPGTASFPELNVRTYVRRGNRPGVWFFSLDDMANPLGLELPPCPAPLRPAPCRRGVAPPAG